MIRLEVNPGMSSRAAYTSAAMPEALTVKITMRLATCKIVIRSSEWAVDRSLGAFPLADLRSKSISSAFILTSLDCISMRVLPLIEWLDGAHLYALT